MFDFLDDRIPSRHFFFHERFKFVFHLLFILTVTFENEFLSFEISLNLISHAVNIAKTCRFVNSRL
jgi:hypothetical protein